MVRSFKGSVPLDGGNGSTREMKDDVEAAH
jgi:hypothetical protein